MLIDTAVTKLHIGCRFLSDINKLQIDDPNAPLDTDSDDDTVRDDGAEQPVNQDVGPGVDAVPEHPPIAQPDTPVAANKVC